MKFPPWNNRRAVMSPKRLVRNGDPVEVPRQLGDRTREAPLPEAARKDDLEPDVRRHLSLHARRRLASAQEDAADQWNL